MADATIVSARAVLAMVFVIGVLAAAAWALRRGVARTRSRQGVAIETALSLGERRSLVIVSVEGRRLLLGLTPTSVGLITDLGTPFTDALNHSLGTKERPETAS